MRASANRSANDYRDELCIEVVQSEPFHTRRGGNADIGRSGIVIRAAFIQRSFDCMGVCMYARDALDEVKIKAVDMTPLLVDER